MIVARDVHCTIHSTAFFSTEDCEGTNAFFPTKVSARYALCGTCLNTVASPHQTELITLQATHSHLFASAVLVSVWSVFTMRKETTPLFPCAIQSASFEQIHAPATYFTCLHNKDTKVHFVSNSLDGPTFWKNMFLQKNQWVELCEYLPAFPSSLEPKLLH